MWHAVRPKLWLPTDAWDFMKANADEKAPKETGGILFGYWIDRFGEVVVSEIIGPGPDAEHERSHFRPDADYQESELARLYEEYGRLHTYLGDWHTHPIGGAYLSRKDRRTLRNIARYEPARAPFPIMAVMARERIDWTVLAWRWPGRGPRWPSYPRFEVELYG